MSVKSLLVCGVFILSALLTSCMPFDNEAVSSQVVVHLMPRGFVYVDEVAPEVKVNLLYASSDNFIGRPLAGYEGKRAILREDAAKALRDASVYFRERGYALFITDAYRPHVAMIDLNTWLKDGGDQKMKAKYYPRIQKLHILRDKYLNEFSEHSFGIAIDVTLVNAVTGKPVDMGGCIDLLDPGSALISPELTPRQQANRLILRDGLTAFGFTNYSKEWWHYYYKKNPEPFLLYNFPVRDDMVKKVPSPR